MDAVQCWCVRLDVAPPPETYYATLSEDERNRSARFRFERDRQRFIVAHGALRDLLGRSLGTDPGRIRFVYNAFGKPELDPAFGERLKFNLSHSADLALMPSPGTHGSASMSNASTGAGNRITPRSRGVSSRQRKLTR